MIVARHQALIAQDATPVILIIVSIWLAITVIAIEIVMSKIIIGIIPGRAIIGIERVALRAAMTVIFFGESMVAVERPQSRIPIPLNLSPPTSSRRRVVRSPSRSATTSPTSPQSSCVSSEMNQDDQSVRYSTSPETSSMVLVGCPRCLMYVMLSQDDPKCPKCKSTVLLDFNHENASNANAPADASSGRKTWRN